MVLRAHSLHWLSRIKPPGSSPTLTVRVVPLFPLLLPQLLVFSLSLLVRTAGYKMLHSTGYLPCLHSRLSSLGSRSVSRISASVKDGRCKDIPLTSLPSAPNLVLSDLMSASFSTSSFSLHSSTFPSLQSTWLFCRHHNVFNASSASTSHCQSLWPSTSLTSSGSAPQSFVRTIWISSLASAS